MDSKLVSLGSSKNFGEAPHLFPSSLSRLRKPVVRKFRGCENNRREIWMIKGKDVPLQQKKTIKTGINIKLYAECQFV